MATIQTRGKRFRAIVRKAGFSKSKTFNTKLEAVRWAEELEHDLSSGARVLYGKTVRDAFERYADEVSPAKKGARWEIIRLKKLSRQSWTAIQLTDLHPDDIQDWVDNNKLSAGSIIREYCLVRSVLETTRRQWKWIRTNPAIDVRKPRKPQPRDRRISDDEIKAVLEALRYDPDAKHRGCAWETGHAFLLALETAMRRGEIWGLDWKDIHFERQFLTLHETKNGTRRDVPLSSKAIDLLKIQNPKGSGRVFKTVASSAEVIFRGKLKKAGIVNLRFHDTRHEALTRLSSKLEVLELARMVGHKDLRSLMIYYNATAEELAKKLG